MMKVTILAIMVFLLATATALAGGDSKKGKRVFKKCRSCHMVGEGAKVKIGPPLNDLFGATAGANPIYAKRYSKAMRKAGEDGLIWNEETIAKYLSGPRAMVKKTKMSFRGLKKEKDISNIIAYLLTFSPQYKPDKDEQAADKESKTEKIERPETSQ